MILVFGTFMVVSSRLKEKRLKATRIVAFHSKKRRLKRSLIEDTKKDNRRITKKDTKKNTKRR